MRRLLSLPWRFFKVCWTHGAAAALALTYELVVRRRFALDVKFPYESPSNAAAWVPLLKNRPLISVIMPVYNSRWLQEAVESVSRQSYDHYELILVDDCSNAPATLRALEAAQQKPYVRLLRTPKNLGISGATNFGAAAARGEYLGFMDHDDLLHPDALAIIARAINRHPPADIYFTDEARLDENGHIVGFTRKSQPSLDNLLACNGVAHFCVIRRPVWEKLGGLDSCYDGAQDHELMLRAWGLGLNFLHIPCVLYGWRLHRQSMSGNIRQARQADAPQAWPAAYLAGKRAIADYLARHGIPGSVTDDGFPWYRVKYPLPQPLPEIGVIIPFRDKADYLRRLLKSLEKTSYPNYRLYLVDNQSVDPSTRQFLASLPSARCETIRFDEPFNYSRLHNVVVKQLPQEYLVLLNNDLELISPAWLEAMLEHAAREKVAAVGCRLLYPNGKLQHGGMTFAPNMWRTVRNLDDDSEHYPHIQREVAGVTAAAMMMRRSAFLAVGGFDEVDFPIGFSDADLCLRLRQAGYKIIYTPFAIFRHYESGSRCRQEEVYEKYTLCRRYYASGLLMDPHYHTLLEA